MSQAPNLGRLLRMLNLNHSKKITKWKIVEGICISRPSLLKASLYQPKRVNKFFLLKNSFNYECNLIHAVICQGCKEEYIGETGCVVKERINIYRQHSKTAAISATGSWSTSTFLWNRKVSYVSFFQDYSIK